MNPKVDGECDLRRGRDSNPRWVAPHMISNHAPSATRTPLQVVHTRVIGSMLGGKRETCFARPISVGRAKSLAEREGFEPSESVNPHQISSLAPSTTRTPLQVSLGGGEYQDPQARQPRSAATRRSGLRTSVPCLNASGAHLSHERFTGSIGPFRTLWSLAAVSPPRPRHRGVKERVGLELPASRRKIRVPVRERPGDALRTGMTSSPAFPGRPDPSGYSGATSSSLSGATLASSASNQGAIAGSSACAA